MPGIFLSLVQKGNKEQAPKIPNELDPYFLEEHSGKFRFGIKFALQSANSFFSRIFSRLHTRKAFFLLLLLLIPFFLKDWNTSLTKVFDLPTKHLDFIGREKELTFLKGQLLKKRENREINLVAISGEGGIGKTELAIAFANDHIDDFSLISWMDGSSEEALIHSYAGLGDLLEIKEEHPVRLREKVHWKLENFKGKPWMLIMDDMRAIPSDLPKSGGSVLMTCRDKSICPKEAVMELTKNTEEAVLLLSQLTGEDKLELVGKLAEKLDYLPLMINLAGHYIAETPGINLSNYSDIISSIMETEESPLKRVEFRKRYPRSLAATYLITLKMLEQKQPLSLEFLKEANFLHFKNIPEELLTCWLEEKGKFSPAQIALLKGDILRELQNHSLIRYDSNRGDFSIHQLLHQTLILEFSEEKNVSEILKILTKLNSVRLYNPTQKDTIRPFQKILPHGLAILDQVKDPDDQAVNLALTVARYFVDTEHQLIKGKRYLDLAQHWAEDWNHPINGRIAFLQGILQFREADLQLEDNEKKKRYWKALGYFNEALGIFRAQNNDDLYQAIEQNPLKCTKEYQRTICVQYQGQTMRVLGLLEEAEKAFKDALEDFQSITGGKDHFDIARILREQALILWEREQQEAAIQKLEQAMSMQERVYGDAFLFQPTVAATYRILGDFLLKRGEFLKSDQAYQKASEVNQVIYQTEVHPYQADLFHLRAEALAALGEAALAEKMEKKAQKIQALLKQSM